MVASIPSASPNDINLSAELTPERFREIRDLLRYETSISFHSARAKKSMLLLVAGVEQIRQEAAAAHASETTLQQQIDSQAEEIGRLRAALAETNEKLADQERTTKYFSDQASRRGTSLREATELIAELESDLGGATARASALKAGGQS